MGKVQYLFGGEEAKYRSETQAIIEQENQGIIYVLNNPKEKLYDYIDYLHDAFGISNQIIFKMKICREVRFDGNVLVYDGKHSFKPANMKELLEQLEWDREYSIVIENNSRQLLAETMQQLVYLDFPIHQIDVKLKKEFKDAQKTKRFMEKAELMLEGTKEAIERITRLQIRASNEEEAKKLEQIKTQTLESFRLIKEQLDKATGLEMKIAVAASKKTGKSVIVNSMIGMELAPTSLEMATPNTCIYQKSADDKFHLHMSGENGQDFDNKFAIYSAVKEKFREAQNNADDKFSIPDMTIQYVSDKNSFESFTIFDTPGPDAAGTSHQESAKKSMLQSDVAVFAIDYTKYLTTSEASYLAEIKDIFEQNKKFHTLLFTINKIDQMLEEKETKSKAKTIDFIRNRLIDIDPKYRDCIIFTTSAKDYFATLELEDRAKEHELCKRACEVDIYKEFRSLMDEVNDEDTNLRELFSELDNKASNLRNKLGIKAVTLDTIKNFSGMPQFLSYLSYVAQSKAREEIVNNITHIVNREKNRIQDIINEMENINRLLHANEDKINEIRLILNEYETNVANAIKEEITEEDIQNLLLADGKALPAYVDRLKKERPGVAISFYDIFRMQVDDFEKGSTDHEGEAIYNKFCKYWYQKMDALYLEMDSKGERKYEFSASKVEFTPFELKEIVNERLREIWYRMLSGRRKIIDATIGDIERVLERRMECVREQSVICQSKLEKADVVLSLPELPSFDVSLEKRVQYKEVTPDASTLELSESVFKGVNIFRAWFREFLGEEKLIVFKAKDIRTYKKDIEKNKDAIKIWVTESVGMDSKVTTLYKEVKATFMEEQRGVQTQFENESHHLRESIEVFSRSVDESEKYRNSNLSLEERRTLIEDICDASSKFMDTWNLAIFEEGGENGIISN